ncbi:glycosyltransferase [Candidatus Dependentiae bacterium]|nr:glycosyltransferase [Candidatus Dependentiae bacterium]
MVVNGAPKISVVLPTYNGLTRGFVTYAIESVLQQTYKNFELLIVDDGSSDDTRELCQKYLADHRVTYLHQKNSGVSAARNHGIKKSSGDYIAFLDDDDSWLPEKLEKQLSFVENLCDSQFGLCYTALEFMTKDGRKTGIIQSHHAEKNIFREMLYENIVDCTSSVLVPRSVLDDVGLFQEHLSYAEDYDLWLRIAKKYHIYSIDEPLALYREHSNKLSSNLEKMEFYALVVTFHALQDAELIDKNHVFNYIYKSRAAYRFWLGDYDVFRRYVRFAKTYGPLGVVLRLRFMVSYAPWFIHGVRRVKKYFTRLVIFLILGSCL